MDSAWIQRPVKLIQSDSDGVIIIQTDSDKFQKNSDRFSLIQNFLFMRDNKIIKIDKCNNLKSISNHITSSCMREKLSEQRE